MTFKDKYKEELSDIRFTENFEKSTITFLVQAAERKDKTNMNKSIKKTTRILVATVLIIAVLSTTALALSKLLSAREVAEHFGESQVAESFDNQFYITESVTDKGYTVSFLGLVKGEKFESKDIKSDCSYYVVAVAASDGSPLSLINGNPLGMSIIIEGYPAWKINTWSLGTSANGTEENGILYYLYACENLEIFADKNVYLAVYEGMLPGLDTITMKTDGTFEFAKSYEGFKAMFRLPLDSSKANPEVANEILKEYLIEETEINTESYDSTNNNDASQENKSTNDVIDNSTYNKESSQKNESVSEAADNSTTSPDDELNLESEMEPMPNYKDKWRKTFSLPA